MYRAVLLMLLVGIHCNPSGATAPDPRPGDLGIAALDLSVAADLSATAAADLSMAAPDLGAPADLSPPAPVRVCSKDNWCWENPLPQGNWLTGIWAADANNIWIVEDRQGRVLKWNGSRWAQESVGSTQYLSGVWGTDANNVWAVGTGGLVAKWNGTTWAMQSSGTTQNLTSIWGMNANNIWVVGLGGTILNANYESPIRTHTDLRMEMACVRPTCPSQVMSLFRTFRT